jgi:hypothetical protein
MPIYRLLQNIPLGPEQIGQLTTAYETALRGLGLKDRDDPLADLVARQVFETWQTGIVDPAELAKSVIAKLGIADH